MIFDRKATDICVSFEGMDNEEEKALADVLYAGIKRIHDYKTPWMYWPQYAVEHHLLPILGYLNLYYNTHTFQCREWDRHLWYEAFVEERKRKGQSTNDQETQK